MTTQNVLLRIAMVVLCGATACAKQAEGPTAAAENPADGPASIAVPANLLDAIGKADAKAGEALFISKGCKACHNLTDVKLVGPGLKGVTSRRSLPWMARMILHPEVMVKEDPEAKKLFAALMTPMANQNVQPDAELPALLAFLKTL